MDNVILEVKEFIEMAEKASDPRSKDWLLVKHISSPLLAICIYVVVVLIGPLIMKRRQAFVLRKTMAFYNFVAVILSAYIAIKLLHTSISENYSYICQKIDHTFENPMQLEMARTIWWVYVSKYFELFDTLFFILRKKDNQISFLHVYHHSTVVILWWVATRWLPGGSTFFTPLINSLVHVVMYTYYGLSVFSSLKKYLWWKKYITQIQMIQFCALFFNGVLVIFSKCGYPRWMAYLLMSYSVTLFLLFGDFYLQAYKKSKEQKKDIMRRDANGSQMSQNNHLKKVT